MSTQGSARSPVPRDEGYIWDAVRELRDRHTGRTQRPII